MKFTLVCLIAICTIAAQGSAYQHHENKLSLNYYGRNGLLDRLRELIDAIVQSIQKTIDTILGEAQEIIDAVLETVQKIVDKAQQVLENTLKKILDKLDEIAKQSEAARKCVEVNKPALEAAVEEAQQQLEVCNNNAIEQSKNILNDIENEVDAVRKNIDALNDVIDNCLGKSKHPLEVALCVTKQSSEIRDQSLELIKNARNALEAGATRAAEIATEANSCTAKAAGVAQDKLDTIVNDIQKCIDAGHFKFLLN